MHRPPKPAIKSSQVFPLHSLRRIFTPDVMYWEHDTPIPQHPLKNCRDNIMPVHQSSFGQPEPADRCEPVIVKAPTASHTRSFKIRTHSTSNRIK